MNNIVKLGLNLFTICAVAAMALGATNQITAPVIDQRNIQSNNESRKIVLQDANDFKKIGDSKYENKNSIISEIYEGTDGSKTVGYTVKVMPKGYGGAIELIVGISSEGIVSGINIGSMTETPGLGAKISDESFTSQYKGKPTKDLKVVKSGASSEIEIQAISGATISSDAVTQGVNEAIKVYNSSLKNK